MFRLDLLPATYGDCLVLSYGGRKIRHVLIDAGTTQTYEEHLKPHFEREGITDLELFVMTHIDADHIAGAIPMLEDPDLPVDIREVWFNGRPQLSDRFLSVKQGERFSELIEERELPWNAEFGGKAIETGDELRTVRLTGGLELTILSPTSSRLDRLARKWQKEIDRHFLSGGRGTARRRSFLARTPTTSTNVDKLAESEFKSDTSVPNGSSIALLAQYGKKRILLAGDAYSSVLRDSIKRLQPDGSRMELDALKVSHHGSRGNTDNRLIEMLDCDRFLISCDGSVHRLPDNEAIGRIIKHGGASPGVFFNYRCKRTKMWDDDRLRTKYGYTTEYGDRGFLRIDF